MNKFEKKQTEFELICLFHSPSKYREHALLDNFVSENRINISVFYEKYKKDDEIDFLSNANYKYFKSAWYILPSKSLFFSIIKSIIKKNSKTLFWVAGWNSSPNIIFLFLLLIFRRHYLLWTDTISTHERRISVKEALRKLFLFIIIRNSFKVLTTGEPGINAFKKFNYFGSKSNKFIDFPCYINTICYKPISSSKRKNADKIRILSVGWLKDNLKGQSITLNALSMLPTTLNFEMNFIGSGPDLENLIEISNTLGLVGKVNFLGQKNADEIIDFYHSSDILIHSSPIHEPYGVVISEAMASGLVVIASDSTCAALDSINDGWNGYIYPSGNSIQLAEILKSSLNDYCVLEDIKLNSLKTSQKWDIQNGINQLNKIFNQLYL